MNLLELIQLSLEALKSNLVRTLLTMLGVIIGIASVIIIMSLGQGATQSIVGEFSSLGANVLTVSASKGFRGPGSGGGGTIDTLTIDDAEAIEKLTNITATSGVVTTNKQVLYEGDTSSESITGVEESYAPINSISVSQGGFITDSHNNSRSKVIVVGDELVEELFGEDAEVVGESIRIDGKSFRIIGVVPDSSSIYAPLTTVQKVLLSQDYLGSISVAVVDSDQVAIAQTNIENTLYLRHEIENEEDADFSVRGSQTILDSISSVTGTLTGLLSGIAAISLVVGGIGIMNIMLVTVTERTKEIGLLKAIGAKKKDILTQFLIEAIVVTVAGGIVGIMIGIVITFVATSILSIPFVVSLQSIILALLVSASVGLIFGYYPAKQAANLQPIDALRHE